MMWTCGSPDEEAVLMSFSVPLSISWYHSIYATIQDISTWHLNVAICPGLAVTLLIIFWMCGFPQVLILSMLSMTPLLLLVKTPMRQHKIEKNQWWWNMMNYVWSRSDLFLDMVLLPNKKRHHQKSPADNLFRLFIIIIVSIIFKKIWQIVHCLLAGWAIYHQVYCY